MMRSVLLWVSMAAMAATPQADLEISGTMHGATLTMRTSARTAGAIDSITWRGKEFINAFDHGRELQSASSFDGYGECLNPTEAGSEKDGAGQATSSRLLASGVDGHTLETTIEMAYWLAPGASYPRPCGSHQDFRRARNETVRSSDTLIKRVTIGAEWIDYDITFVTTEDYQSATFEALTGYMPPGFSEFLAYDPATHAIVPLSDGPGEQPLPVILATPDHKFAMGVISPHAGYGRFRFPDTVKWNAVYRESPVPKGRYHYRCSVFIGTLNDVRDAMVHSIR